MLERGKSVQTPLASAYEEHDSVSLGSDEMSLGSNENSDAPSRNENSVSGNDKFLIII